MKLQPGIISDRTNWGYNRLGYYMARNRRPAMAIEPSFHVLVVDDELAILKLITALLKTSGYKTLSAMNGREAFALFKEHENEINLLITDIVMPEMDGVELAVQIH